MIRQCVSYPGYSATDDCKIISHRRKGTGTQRGSVPCIDLSFSFELKQQETGKGYMNVGIMLPTGKAGSVGVHRLVSDAFHGPCPNGLQVRHLNGNPKDNRPNNLRYGTAKENADDRMKHGTYLGGSSHHGSKLTSGQATQIRVRRRHGEKVRDLASDFNVSTSTIESIIYGKSYKPALIEFKRAQEQSND